MNQKVKAGYNVAAKNYTTTYRDKFKNEKYLEVLVNILPVGSHILDIGCGAGKPIDTYLLAKGMKLVGIDISEVQIELAKLNCPDAYYEAKDMSELRDGEYGVDAVVSFYAIFHTKREKHLELLKKFRTFLNAGGYLLITMGFSDWEGKEDNFCGTEMYWSHYDSEKNKELIKQAGYKIITAEVDESGGEKHLVVLAQAL